MLEILTAVLLPPGLAIGMLMAGMVIHHWHKWAGRWCLVVSLLVLVLASSEAVGFRALASLQTWPPLSSWPNDGKPLALVVLGGGVRSRAPAFQGEDAPNALTLERLRLAAHLARQHTVDILLSGGRKKPAVSPEAVLMNQVLVEEYGMPVRWLETESTNTVENAKFSAVLLKKAGINRVILVTHAWHMPRAKMLFEQQGLMVLPAPVGFVPERPPVTPKWLAYLPSARGMALTALALRERWAYWWENGQGEALSVTGSPAAQSVDNSRASAN